MSTDIISDLFDQGNVFVALLREAKTNGPNIKERVERVTTHLIDRLKNQRGSFPSEDSLVKILRKVEWTLTEFTKLDPTNEPQYRGLATSVVEYVSTIESPRPRRGPRHQYTIVSGADYNQDSAFSELQEDQMILLKTLCLLPDGACIKKQDMWLWWRALAKYWTDGDYERWLTELIDRGFIQVVAMTHSDPTRLAGLAAPDGVRMRAKRPPLKYRLRDGMHDKISSQQGKCSICRQNSMSVLHEDYESRRGLSARAVLNINGHKLDAKTFDWISRLGLASLIHLGDWKDDPKRYIVVQHNLDRAFNRYSWIRFLSLQGVSGIVELPEGIYKLSDLSTLILRGCHNLENIPDGIQSLSRLEYLDLSECYLLNHIPKGIGALSNLTVLKGFIIPEYQDPAQSRALLLDLLQLRELRKLTLRNRRLNFPRGSDLAALSELESLASLKITWVGASSSVEQIETNFDDALGFLNRIEKFEIEAAPECIATPLMERISRHKPKKLKKFYIRGGGLRKLVPIHADCEVFRLHYLPELQLNCQQMMSDFSTLRRLEMSSDVIYSLLRQSFKRAIGCPDALDSDVAWNRSLECHGTPDGPSM